MDVILGIIGALLALAWLDSHKPEVRDVDRLSRWMGPTMKERRRR